jgi:hypothetical protein
VILCLHFEEMYCGFQQLFSLSPESQSRDRDTGAQGLACLRVVGSVKLDTLASHQYPSASGPLRTSSLSQG